MLKFDYIIFYMYDAHWISFQIFVKDNLSGDETTQIDYLAIYGSPINVTNMNEFKRVSYYFALSDLL